MSGAGKLFILSFFYFKFTLKNYEDTVTLKVILSRLYKYKLSYI